MLPVDGSAAAAVDGVNTMDASGAGGSGSGMPQAPLERLVSQVRDPQHAYLGVCVAFLETFRIRILESLLNALPRNFLERSAHCDPSAALACYSSPIPHLHSTNLSHAQESAGRRGGWWGGGTGARGRSAAAVARPFWAVGGSHGVLLPMAA